jgi:hypothetical protein
MSALIVTVLKLLGSIVSGGLLFQAFVSSHHTKPITKIAGVIVSLITLLMFVVDIKDVLPDDEADKTEQIYWESVDQHPSPSAYRAYLTQYPHGQFATLARTQIANYAKAMPVVKASQTISTLKKTETPNVNVPDIEKLYWESVEKYPDVTSYQDYLKHYPDGKFANIARNQLNNATKIILATPVPSEASITAIDEAHTMEQLYWDSIQKSPSARLYREYLRHYPGGKFVALAHTQLTHYTKSVQQAKLPVVADWQSIAHYQVKDGLVTDTQTDLMWMRCSLGQHWQGTSCQGKAASFTFEQAMDSFKNFDYAGYTDWRVPTRDELKTLVYCSSGKTQSVGDKGLVACAGDYASPTIDKTAFPETPAWFWSSSPYANSNSYAWYVFFGYGYDDWSYKYNDYQVRLVRNR